MDSLNPEVSIIIPCRNEVGFIDRCLESILDKESLVCSFEILVVDGLSTDGTQEILKRWSDMHDEIRILQNPQQIVPTAMNIGIRQSRGQWIIRLDAHAEYSRNYVRQCLETSISTGADNVGGVFVTLPRGHTYQARLVQALTTHRFGVGNADFRLNAEEGYADTVPYGCYRREVFERIGLYDERLVRNQDYELNRRLINVGGRIWRNPDIKVYYYNQPNIHGLMRQAFLTGSWNPWMWYAAPYSFALRHAVPAAFVLTIVVLILLSKQVPGAALGLALVAVMYLILALIASFQQAKYLSWVVAVPLPVLFFLYHFTYGLGIIAGVVQLAARKAPVQVRKYSTLGEDRYRPTL